MYYFVIYATRRLSADAVMSVLQGYLSRGLASIQPTVWNIEDERCWKIQNFGRARTLSESQIRVHVLDESFQMH